MQAGVGIVLGLVGVAVALMLASRANGLWRQATLLLRGPPLDIEEAAARLDAGELRGPVLLKGKLGAIDPVISPGGVLCAFYDAEIRRPGVLGRGIFLSQDRASASTLVVKGGREQVRIEARKEGLHAPMASRKCEVGGRMAFGLSAALAEGNHVEEAISRERVGKLNDPCTVLGRLERDARGRLVIRRSRDLVPLVSAGEGAEHVSQRIAHRAALLAVAAAASTCFAGALAAAF